MPTNRQVLLVEKPSGKLEEGHFRLVESAMPDVAEGEVLLHSRYLSLDAANRAWMQGATYRSAIDAGTVMAGGGIAEVVESRDASLRTGDLGSAETGWQDYAAVPGRHARKVEPREPLTHLLSVYGGTGLTAYFGLLRVGRPAAGETVVVSAAAGAVGTLVGQIAKIRGCRVVGIAGGAEKCAWLRDELSFDATVDYRAGPVYGALKDAAPGGVDVYFDNVGGEIFEACLFRMNNRGRIVCCGAVSSYDGPPPAHGPRGVPGLIVVRRLTVQGFIVMDYDDERETALADLEGWVRSGQLKVYEDVVEGLENAPRGLVGLLAGQNRGKRMVHVS